MRVQNNNQPNFGLKINVDESFAKSVVTLGWEKEATATIKKLEDRFVKNNSTIALSGNKIVYGEYSSDHLISDGKGLETAVVAAVNGAKAIASLPKRVASLNKKHGVNIALELPHLFTSHTSNSDNLRSHVDKIAQDLAKVPKKDKYAVIIRPNAFAGKDHFKVYICRGKEYNDGFDFDTSERAEKGLNYVKEAVKSVEEMRRSAAKERVAARLRVRVKREIERKVGDFMALINGRSK